MRGRSDKQHRGVDESQMVEKTVLIGVIGTRTNGDMLTTALVGKRVTQLFNLLDKNKHIVVSGGCPTGADYWAKRLCKERKIRYLEAVAFWNTNKGLDKGAGLFRNRTIVQVCGKVYAFWDMKSPGTKSAIDYAKEIGTPVQIIQV